MKVIGCVICHLCSDAPAILGGPFWGARGSDRFTFYCEIVVCHGCLTKTGHRP